MVDLTGKIRGSERRGPGRLRRWRQRSATDWDLLRRNGDVRRLVSSHFASILGTSMVIAAMPFAVKSIGGTDGQVGIALAAQGLAIVPGLLVGGVLGDRIPRRSVMVAADLLRLASQASIAVLLFLGDAAYWQLIAAQLVHGFGTGAFMPASKAIVRDTVAMPYVQPTHGLKQVAAAVGGIGGAALGAAVCAISPGLAMGADAVTFLISAAVLIGLPTVQRETREATIAADLREGWRIFVSLPWLRSVTVQFAVINALVIAPFFVFAPLTAEESLGGPWVWSMILVAVTVGELAGGVAAMSMRPRRPVVTATLIFPAWGLMLICLALLAPLPVLAAAAVLAGISNAVLEVLWDTTVTTKIKDPDKIARVSSFDEIGSLAVVPFGFLIGGVIEETAGATRGLIGGAVLLVVAAAVVLLVPSVRQLEADYGEDERQAAPLPQPVPVPVGGHAGGA